MNVHLTCCHNRFMMCISQATKLYTLNLCSAVNYILIQLEENPKKQRTKTELSFLSH